MEVRQLSEETSRFDLKPGGFERGDVIVTKEKHTSCNGWAIKISGFL